MSDDLSLEKLRINDRLTHVEDGLFTVKTTLAPIDERSKLMMKMMEDMHAVVMGDGTKQNPGLSGRILLIENYQDYDKEDKKTDFTMIHKLMLYGGIIGSIVSGFFHKHGTP